MKTCNKCRVELVRGKNIAPSSYKSGHRVCRDCRGVKRRRIGTNPNPNCNICGVNLVKGVNILPSQFDKSNFKCKSCRKEEAIAYGKTPEGKASVKKSNDSPKKKIRSDRYVHSEKGKATGRRNAKAHYHRSLKNDPEYKAERSAYRQTDSAKASGKRTKAKNVANGKAAFWAQNYKAAKLLRTPDWLTKRDWELMEAMWMDCPKGFSVDHIYPLQGVDVSGLHVPSNLKYLTASENSTKGNRWVA